MSRFLTLIALFISTPALAGEILIESEPFIQRGDAVVRHGEVMAALPEDTTATVRLVRRFHQGQGWRYLVVIEGAQSAAAAQALAEVAQGLEVILPADMVLEPEPIIEPVEPVVAPAEPDGPRLLDATGVLRAAVRAHGGHEGAGIMLGQAESVRFSYTRAVPEEDGELIAVNHFLRKGEAVRLEVEIESGSGTNSTTTLTADQHGWVSVGDEHTERDSGRTLEILERFSPEAVLAIPLGFPEDVETAAAWRSLETVDRLTEGEVEVWLLRGPEVDGEASGLKEASFGVRERRLKRVTWGSPRGDITFTYDDYQTLGDDLIIPFRTRIERDGELIEEITVSNFEVNPLLDDVLFAAPQ